MGGIIKKRPGLYAMLDRIRERFLLDSEKFPKDITFAWNSATHGDPFSPRWNLAEFDGVIAHPVSKNLKAPKIVDDICCEVIPWLGTTMGMMGAAFGKDEVGVSQ